ncbi:MAG: di-trans,poly-cis-decaprenylcistransferase [Bacteroidales bacterium]|jgi:undecaprenyl diphosphate synthase|nr:di-trans,poly-cis-decaprenylcistransferase [Bacteroidales bacterium]
MQEESKIPVHVSIIMDGNGRWARERGQERVFGHKNGVQSVKACVEQAGRRGVKYLSLFAFSEENWARPQDEVSTLMDMMMKSIHDEVNNLRDNGVRFLVLGNRARLSKPLQAAIASLEATTKNNTVLTLIVFLSYSGKWDISQAAAKMAAAGDTDLEKYLVTNGIPDPDLIIRTSGEQRISNFMLWQAAYSEWYFPETLWPDFREKEFDKALEEYAKRDRRYGKVK